jgi:hypothetical protein
MTESSGVPSPLGIEAVEWFAEGGENLTVRVTGRWRRRRPAWSGQPTLVIEASGRRYRFPAMPEPPSLTGTGPGMWRISFSVPAALAPDLGGRTWLQFGAVVVPLPTAVEPMGGALDPAHGGDGPGAVAEPVSEPVSEPMSEPPAPPAYPGERPLPSPELETETARRRAAEAEAALADLAARAEALERDLATARAEFEQLSYTLAGEQVSRRAAEQRAHAERALRVDLARQLAARARDSDRAREALGDLAAAEDRVRDLELELSEARRKIDEAEQVAAAAAVARQRAERRAAEVAAGGGVDRDSPGQAERDRLGFEQGLISRRAAAGRRIPSEPVLAALASVPSVPGPPAAASPPGVPGPSAAASPPGGPGASAAASPPGGPEPPSEPQHGDALVPALRAEIALRARAETGLRSRLVEAEARLAARELLERRTRATLAQLRDELDGLRGAFELERAAREAAERRATALELELGGQRERSHEAYQAIGELRETLEALRGPRAAPEGLAETGSGGESSGAGLEPERFSEALVRLREQIAPREAGASPQTRGAAGAPGGATEPSAWLAPAFRALVKTDADRAGRLLLDLLPAQHLVHPQPVAYDLVLGGERSCARVTVSDQGVAIVLADAPRSPNDVDFQVFGDHAATARLLTAGWFRRRFSRRVARVRGNRAKLEALEALVGLRVGLSALYGAGVRMQPRTALTLAAGLIQPEWTAREEFSIAYTSPDAGTAYLVVRDGAPPQASEVAPAAPAVTTIAGPPGSFELIVSGERPELVTVTGDEWPLALVRKWINRAQSG